MTAPQSSFTKKRLAMILAGGIAGIIVGLAGVYGVSTLTRNVGGDAACAPAVELANKIAPFARGEVAAVNVAKNPLKLPSLTFADAAGKELPGKRDTLIGIHQRSFESIEGLDHEFKQRV